jgi:predicted O-methyltransferase YrrM
LDAVHDALDLVESIPGWLRPEDASKLYELAHATAGPILEIGTYHGKSSILMATAITDANHDTIVYTLDADRYVVAEAATEAERRGVADRIIFVRGTVGAFARAYPHLRPAVTFVDGDHSRAGVQRDLAVLETLVPKGGVLLFHDFNDPSNDDPGCTEVKVRPAVDASWVSTQCDFGGTFGACGMFTRRVAPNQSAAMKADLLPLAGIREQYEQRLRYPAGRLWHKVLPGR